MPPCSVFLLPPVPALPSFALVYFFALMTKSIFFTAFLSFPSPFPFYLSPFSVVQALSFFVSFSSFFTLNFHDFPWLLLPPVVLFPPLFLFHLGVICSASAPWPLAPPPLPTQLSAAGHRLSIISKQISCSPLVNILSTSVIDACLKRD